MIDPSNNSFIPKRGPAKLKRTNASKQIYVFTIISYVIMFASLLSAGGVFLYSKYFVQKQRDDIVVKLDTAIKVFSESDLQKVINFDNRLQQASDKFESSVALGSLFKAFEAATIDTFQIESLNIKRDKDDKLVLDTKMKTDSVSSIILQRLAYRGNDLTNSVAVKSISVNKPSDEDSGQNSFQRVDIGFEVPLSDVPYEGGKFEFTAGVPIEVDTPTGLDNNNEGVVTDNTDSASGNQNNI